MVGFALKGSASAGEIASMSGVQGQEHDVLESLEKKDLLLLKLENL